MLPRFGYSATRDAPETLCSCFCFRPFFCGRDPLPFGVRGRVSCAGLACALGSPQGLRAQDTLRRLGCIALSAIRKGSLPTPGPFKVRISIAPGPAPASSQGAGSCATVVSPAS